MLTALLLACTPGPRPSPAEPTEPVQRAGLPWIIGHRGDPAHLPDHTLEGYRSAIAKGADAFEPDLAPSSDGVLFARHENLLDATTDVATRLPGRSRTQSVDGAEHTGWFSEDLTAAEMATLRAVQPFPGRPHGHDGQYGIPTLDALLELRASLEGELGRPVGVVPELKHPSHFRAAGLPVEPALIDALRRHGLTDADDPVVVQSFEPTALERVGAELAVRRLLLVGEPHERPADGGPTYGELLADLPALRTRVEAVGVDRSVLWGPDGPTGFLERAHAAGLAVHVWTFRPEPDRVGPAGEGDARRELQVFLGMGVDAVFADDPAMAVAAREAVHRKRSKEVP